jgi:hypothetical protein
LSGRDQPHDLFGGYRSRGRRLTVPPEQATPHDGRSETQHATNQAPNAARYNGWLCPRLLQRSVDVDSTKRQPIPGVRDRIDTPPNNWLTVFGRIGVRIVTTTVSPYVVRFQLTPRLAVALPAWSVMAVVGLPASIFLWHASAPDPGADRPILTWVMIVLLALSTPFFVGYVLFWAIAVARKRVALHLDPRAVTLGGQPFPPRPAVTVPWFDLDAIVLFENQERYSTWPYIGLRLRDGAIRPYGVPEPGSVRARLNRKPAEVSRRVFGYNLDEAQLIQAIHVYGPHVRLVADGRNRR